MEKRNTYKKVLSFLLAMTICLSLPFSVYAETVAEPPVQNADGTQTAVTTTTTTQTAPDGTTTVTVTIEQTTTGTTNDGVDVNGYSYASTSTTTDANGNLVGSSRENGGTETRSWREENTSGENLPPVTVELIPGQATTGSATGVPSVEVEGDQPEGPDDDHYDYTTTTTTAERTVTANASDITVTINTEETNLTGAIGPEDYEGKTYDQGTIGNNNQPTGLINSTTKDKGTRGGESPAEGYDYLISGSGEGTFAACPVFMNVIYKKDEAGNPIKDENGEYIVESAELIYCNSSSVTVQSGMLSPSQIVLKKDGEYFYAYCIDSETSTNSSKWYKVSNLEDAGYFADEESAAKLRAIVSNGYWGTDATVNNEDGTTTVDDTTVGSIARIKTMMRSYYGEDDTIIVQDENGNDVEYKILDLIDGLKEHEALAVTQAAIWSYSNGSLAVENGQDGEKVVGVYSSTKRFSSSGSWYDAYERAYKTDSDARMQALYECLMNLDPIYETDEGVTTIINDKNNFEDMSLTVNDKVAGHTNNADSNADNDVYNTDLTFTLAFVPDTKTDDLLVYLTDQNGTVINDKDGNPIIRRLAGSDTEGRSYDSILPDENGVYTLTGLQLQENEDFVFDLRLEGTQYLKEGVYIYTAYGGREQSQTLVGMAEGEREVEVTVGMTISFDVDENNHVVAERQWHSQGDPRNGGGGGGGNGTYRLRNNPDARADEDLMEIPDEEVPLADVPKTGDGTAILAVISALSGMGYAGIQFSAKKKEQ